MNKNQILENILEKHKDNLGIYWRYDEQLSDQQIKEIIFKENGLSGVENELLNLNLEVMDRDIEYVIKEELTEEQYQNEDLVEFLRLELQSHYSLNLKELLKNSEVRLRVELNTNEDLMEISEYENSEYYQLLLDRFNGKIDKEDLKWEMFKRKVLTKGYDLKDVIDFRGHFENLKSFEYNINKFRKWVLLK